MSASSVSVCISTTILTLMNISILSLVVPGMPTTLLPYFMTHFSIALFLCGTISCWIFVKLKLKDRLFNIENSLPSLSLN